MKKIGPLLGRLLVGLVILVIIGLVFLKIEYGTGKPYPDLGSAHGNQEKKLEKLISLDYPPGNIAVAPNGHVYFNYHPLARPKRFSKATVFEWANGKITPFPSLEKQQAFQGTFGMTIDGQNRIWFIEPAALDFKHTRIWAFDLTTKQQVHFYEFPGAEAQYAQDLRVAADGKHVLLANPGLFRFTNSKLLVYSIDDHRVRTVLDGGAPLQPEDWLMQTNEGRPNRLFWGLLNFSGGLDGIEISQDQQWVYLAPMSGSQLYRVPLAAVLDDTLKPDDVASKIDDVGQKPMSDGITVDKKGHVIITDVEHGGLTSVDVTTKKASTLVHSKSILWADGVATGPDSLLYFTDSYIPGYIGQLAGAPDQSTLVSHRPYTIYRLHPY